MLLSNPIVIHAQENEIDKAVDQFAPATIAMRHQIHQNPELGNREFETAKLVADHLRSLGMEVVAEGVETLDQVQFLWQNHCDQVQGYYFSPAVAPQDFTLMVNQKATMSV